MYLKKTALAFLSLLLVPVAPDAFATAYGGSPELSEQLQTTDRKTHEVAVRETLFSISRQYGVSVQDLRDWNNLTSDALSPGTVLYVEPEQTPSRPEREQPGERPRPQQPSPEPQPEREQQRPSEQRMHTVAQGETMFSIARQYNITVQDLAEWNELESSALRIGQRLIVGRGGQAAADQPAEQPITATAPQETERLSLRRDGPAYTYHTVQRGETLSGISRIYGITVSDIRSMNNLQSDVLSIGQELIVGREASSSGVTGLMVESTAQGRFYSYEVQRNDRIATILENHQMDEADFRALNPGMRPSDVRPGQSIVLLAPPTVSHRNPYRRASASQATGTNDAMSVTVYSSNERGQTTTSGELYNPNQLTAAHPSLALGSVVHVQNPENGRGIFVLINDRTTDNRLKLSAKAFNALQLGESSSPQVVVDSRLDR
ncbi:MAG: LysM peptidoglycan-binding domain-containing protein [Balneolia bacterium]|nr:LysM peptidoglycan-binding domain-containing protein [Balneolia bacterium]